MKTKEFIKKVEAMGYLTEIMNNLTFVFDSNNNTVLSISNDRQYGVDCDYNTPATPKLFLIAVEYAKTPVEEREEERKEDKEYFIHVFKGNEGYLNINAVTGKMLMTLDTACETGYVKTKFTLKQIKQLKQRDDIPLDWDRVKFEETD